MINKNIKFKILKFKNRIFKGRPVLVLVYHRINDVVDFQNAGLTVSVSDFEKQLIYFKENFEILKLGDDWKKIKKNALVITFDDGYADNYLNALPLLEKYQIPATIFICSYNINSNEEFWWDRLANLYNQLPKKFINLKGKTVDKSQWSYKVLEKSVRDKNVFKIVENCKKIEELNNVNIELRESFRSLTTEELIELEKSSFIDIELHSHSHNHFSYLSFEEQKTDLIKNISELKKSLNNKKFKYFALPHGAYNSETLKVISEENLEGCLLANNYYSNYKNKFSKKINRILIPSITGHKLKKYLNKYIFDLF